MLDEKIRVHTGMILKEDATGKLFKVLCNCHTSRPKYQTVRAVSMSRDAFSLPTDQERADFINRR